MHLGIYRLDVRIPGLQGLFLQLSPIGHGRSDEKTCEHEANQKPMGHTEHASSSFSMRANVNRETEPVRLVVICQFHRPYLCCPSLCNRTCTNDCRRGAIFASHLGRFGGVKRSALSGPAPLPTPCHSAKARKTVTKSAMASTKATPPNTSAAITCAASSPAWK